MKGRIESMSMSHDGSTLQVVLAIPEGRQHIKVFNEIGDKDADISIKRFRKKRSLDANAYMWVLLDKLAVRLRTTREELYLHYIRTVGVGVDFECQIEAFPLLKTAFKEAKIVDEWIIGEAHMLLVRGYQGTHTYDTEQFSRFLDEIIQDCKDQGIETATPDEQARMMKLWEENHR